MSIRKVGGLVFWHVGVFGGSFYIRSKSPRVRNTIRRARVRQVARLTWASVL